MAAVCLRPAAHHVAVCSRTVLQAQSATQPTQPARTPQRRVSKAHRRGGRAQAASNSPAYGDSPKSAQPQLAAVWQFLDANFLPLGLATALAAGLCFPNQAVAATNANIGVWATTVIFVISGLQMRRGEAAQALEHGPMFALGLLTILFATPLVGYMVLSAPIQPPEFAIGLAVFCCMPTSLSANIALSGVRAAPSVALCILKCAAFASEFGCFAM